MVSFNTGLGFDMHRAESQYEGNKPSTDTSLRREGDINHQIPVTLSNLDSSRDWDYPAPENPPRKYDLRSLAKAPEPDENHEPGFDKDYHSSPKASKLDSQELKLPKEFLSGFNHQGENTRKLASALLTGAPLTTGFNHGELRRLPPDILLGPAIARGDLDQVIEILKVNGSILKAADYDRLINIAKEVGKQLRRPEIIPQALNAVSNLREKNLDNLSPDTTLDFIPILDEDQIRGMSETPEMLMMREKNTQIIKLLGERLTAALNPKLEAYG